MTQVHKITVTASTTAPGFSVVINNKTFRGVHDIQFRQQKDTTRKIQLIMYVPIFVADANVPRITKKTFYFPEDMVKLDKIANLWANALEGEQTSGSEDTD